MTGVIIKDMKMPKNCNECPICTSDACNAIDWKAEKIDFTIRQLSCPLKEVEDEIGTREGI